MQHRDRRGTRAWRGRRLATSLAALLGGLLGAAGACDSGPSAAPAATPPPASPALVQCRQAADCSNASCFASLPGGQCVNCADNPPGCPAGTVCTSDPSGLSATACLRPCARDGDCHPGTRCTAPGLCAAIRCGAGQPACPAPYVCGNVNACARPRCAVGCPFPLTCGGAGFCVEP